VKHLGGDLRTTRSESGCYDAKARAEMDFFSTEMVDWRRVSSQFSRQEGGLTVSEIMDVGVDSGEGIGDDSSGSSGCRE
jgi:hypothetical protein